MFLSFTVFTLVQHCHHFQLQNFPRKRTVLQRYHLRAERGHNGGVNHIVSTIKQELVKLWDYSSIHHQKLSKLLGYRGIISGSSGNQNAKVSPAFIGELYTLLDLRSTDCLSLFILKEYLKENGKDWHSFHLFFKGHFFHPQTTPVPSTGDATMAEEKKVKRSKQSKTVLFWDKSMGDLNLCPSLPLQKRVLLQVAFLRTTFFREAHANVGSTFQKYWQMKPKVKTTLSKMIQKKFHPSSATGTKFIENARKVNISACK